MLSKDWVLVQEEHSLVSIEDAWITVARLDGMDEVFPVFREMPLHFIAFVFFNEGGRCRGQNGLLF